MSKRVTANSTTTGRTGPPLGVDEWSYRMGSLLIVVVRSAHSQSPVTHRSKIGLHLWSIYIFYYRWMLFSKLTRDRCSADRRLSDRLFALGDKFTAKSHSLSNTSDIDFNMVAIGGFCRHSNNSSSCWTGDVCYDRSVTFIGRTACVARQWLSIF